MKKVSFLSRFELASIGRMINNAKYVSKVSGKSFIWVMYDMSKSILFEHVGYLEYNMFGFVNKTKEQRRTFVCYEDSVRLINMLNDRSYFDCFNDKLKFNGIFKEYIGREFIDAKNASYEEFEKFCKGKDVIYCKPNGSCSGKGIYKRVYLNKDTDLHEIHQFMIDNQLFCEDVIKQHPEVSKLNSSSINTIRMCTLLHNDEVYLMYALIRMGVEGMQIDNISSGGMYTIFENEDGIITRPAWSDYDIRLYDVHPTSNIKFEGYKIPYFKEAIEMCKKAAKVVPQIRYIGWDVAITENGPILVEGNQMPGYDMSENCYITKATEGLKPKFEKILGKF